MISLRWSAKDRAVKIATNTTINLLETAINKFSDDPNRDGVWPAVIAAMACRVAASMLIALPNGTGFEHAVTALNLKIEETARTLDSL